MWAKIGAPKPTNTNVVYYCHAFEAPKCMIMSRVLVLDMNNFTDHLYPLGIALAHLQQQGGKSVPFENLLKLSYRPVIIATIDPTTITTLYSTFFLKILKERQTCKLKETHPQ